MSETTWTSASDRATSGRSLRPPALAPARWLAARLHRALDAALRAGELRELDARTLADIGYRRD